MSRGYKTHNSINQELRKQNTTLLLPSYKEKTKSLPPLNISMDHSETCDLSSSYSSSIDGELRSICKKAKHLLYSREYNKADSLRKDANLALLHINSVIQLSKSESLEEDPIAKNLCIQEALSCAHRATQLSPSNLEFSLFYVKLLISYCQRYEEGIEECERSLAVINPISDTADYLRELNFQEDGHVTTEEGCDFYREQLHSFLITARDALIDRNLPERRQDQELYNSSCPVCSEVSDTCKRALALLNSNNFTKADHLLQQANYHRHSSFAFFHRIRALAHYYVYANTYNDDLEAKKQQFQEAITSAERATRLSPFNLEYSLFYANLLTCCSESYQEAVNECERALAVTDPVNFFFEGFLEESTEDLMAFYQLSLRFILQIYSDGPIPHITKECPASSSSSSLASTSANPPPSDKVKSLCDQAQGDTPCPANSIAYIPHDEVKNLTDEALPSTHQGEGHCPSHSSSSSLVPTSTDTHHPDDEVKILCREAIQILRQGDPIKAYHTLNNVCHQHESSSFFHYTRSLVLFNYCRTLTNDPEGRKSKLQETIDSARQATILSPNILEFSLAYVRLLIMNSKFKEAAKECERVFVILDQYDFLPEGYEDKMGLKLKLSATERDRYQKSFHFLWSMLKSPIASAHCKRMLAGKEQAYRIPSCLEYLWPDLTRVNVKDFKKWSEHNSQFLHIISEALEFFQEKHTWKFWLCPRCSDKFEYFESQMQHVLKEHADKLFTELKPLFPEKYDQDWVVKLVNNIVDAKITKNLDTSKPLKLNLGKTCDTYTLEFLPPLLQYYMQNVNSDWVANIVSCSWEPIDVQAMTEDSNRLPLSNDPERKELLKRIQDYYKILILHNYLLKTHLHRILKYAMKEVQALSSVELLMSHGINKLSVDCIRVLDSAQLQTILEFLQIITQDCMLGLYAEPHDPPSDVAFSECDVRIRAFLDDSSPHIDLDLKILSSSDDTSPPDNETKCFPEVNSMLFWLYEHNLMHIIKVWTEQRNKRPMEADRILHKLEKEIEDLTSICTVKGELITYLVHIKHLKGICIKELDGKGQLCRGMTKWKEELAERAETGNDFVISIISAVLTEAEAFRASQNGDSAITYLNNNDENHSKTSSLDDFFIRVAFQKLEESYDKKICTVDGKIMKNLATARQLQLNLEQTCAIDFLVVLLPLLKNYIQEVIMEKLAEQTTRESGASREASLMELLHGAP